jgi:hypothetical protein
MDKLPFGLHENVGRKKKKKTEEKKNNINGCPFSEIMDFANPLQTK